MLPSGLHTSDPIESYEHTERATWQTEITARRQRPRVHREVVSRE